MKDYRRTVPANSSPALGYVDWVDKSGYPVRACLHRDGKWSATVLELAHLLDSFNAPIEGVEAQAEQGALYDLAREMDGKVTYLDLDLALPRGPEVRNLPEESAGGAGHVLDG